MNAFRRREAEREEEEGESIGMCVDLTDSRILQRNSRTPFRNRVEQVQ